QFWITRPYPRTALLGAKLLFVLAFIHLPSFTADAMILSARGFQPWRQVSQLLWKQSIVAMMVTLPALALASVTRNLAQAASAAAAIVIAGALLAGNFGAFPVPWIDPDKARSSIALATLAVAAGGIILLQYSGRRTALARTAGVVAAVAAAALFVYLP